MGIANGKTPDPEELMMRLLRIVCLLATLCLSAQLPAQTKLKDEQVKFFEAKIRPVLVDQCYSCHSADSRDLGGGLQLDSRAGLLKGGDSGAQSCRQASAEFVANSHQAC